jgi:RNA polymerase sigma-70 factor (ECF subfamily)
VWLAGASRWIANGARKLGVRPADAEDCAQEVLIAAARGWATMRAPVDVAADTARRRWVWGILAHRASAFHRSARARVRVRANFETAIGSPSQPSHEERAVALLTIRSLQDATTPERWRAWFAHEVDGIDVREVARTEGAPLQTIYTRLRLAREDFAAFRAREEAIGRGPVIPRRSNRKGKA